MILVLTGVRKLSIFQEVELTTFSSLYNWETLVPIEVPNISLPLLISMSKELSIIKSKGNKIKIIINKNKKIKIKINNY